MQIMFTTDTLRTEANSFQVMVGRYGEMKARRIRQRLDEISAAANLADFAMLPATGCHCMEENTSMVGVFTIRPYILIVEVARNFPSIENFSPAMWEKVVLVEIVSLDGEAK